MKTSNLGSNANIQQNMKLKSSKKVSIPSLDIVTIEESSPVTERISNRDWVTISARLSTFIQIIFAGLATIGFTQLRLVEDSTLLTLLVLDTSVQLVELLFYIVFVCIRQLPVVFRYIDWVITTPTMILTHVLFIEYTKDTTLSISDIFADKSYNIAIMLIFNMYMLTFGLLYELKYLTRYIGFFLGMLSFIGLSSMIFITVGIDDPLAVGLSIYFTVIWSGYGFANLLETRKQTITYNILDIFSKNAYGLFISIYILQNY